MIEEISIAGFRSLKEVRLPLKKLNIIYGKNGSGKSSVAYACQVLKNIMTNPNRSLDSFFNLGFIDLGGFEDVTFKHLEENVMSIELKIASNLPVEITYGVFFMGTYNSFLSLRGGDFHATVEVDFPYKTNRSDEFIFEQYSIMFNGIFCFGEGEVANDFASDLNSLITEIKSTECISVKRGFFNPVYPVEQENLENRLAETINKDEKGTLVEKVNLAIKRIFGKEFRVYNIPGTQNFRMRTVRGEFITEIVNEGFGLNQAIAILFQLLKPETSLALIEEPEIHLHPTAQTALMEVFIDAIQKDKKQILLSTHSENIVSTILAKISEGTLSKDDVQFFLCTSDSGETKIEVQPINEHGQVEGGLMPFMESELENLKKMLKI